MEKLKKFIRSCFKLLFGDTNYIMLKLNITSFLMAVIFLVFGVTYINHSDSALKSTLSSLSGIFFGLWLILTEAQIKSDKFIINFARNLVFILIFIFSFGYIASVLLQQRGFNKFLFIGSTILLYLCIYNVIVIVANVIKVMHELFTKLVSTIFKLSANPFIKFIQNTTVVLISIAGFLAAVYTITETIFNILGYFKQ